MITSDIRNVTVACVRTEGRKREMDGTGSAHGNQVRLDATQTWVASAQTERHRHKNRELESIGPPFSRWGDVDRRAIAVPMVSGCSQNKEMPFADRETMAERRSMVELSYPGATLKRREAKTEE